MSLGLYLSGALTEDGQINEISFEKTIWEKAKLLSYVVPIYGGITPLAKQTNEELDEFRERNTLVPGRLFDSGSMFMVFNEILNNAMSLAATFKVRQLDGYVREFTDQEDSLGPVFVELASSRPATQEKNLDAFRQTGGARSNLIHLPALSIRLALAARLAARGNKIAEQIYEHFKLVFQDISVKCPEIVERDLVLAELYLSFTEREEYGND
jgi:hypothetical protein